MNVIWQGRANLKVVAIIRAEIIHSCEVRDIALDVFGDKFSKAVERFAWVIDGAEVVSMLEFGKGSLDGQTCAIAIDCNPCFGTAKGVANRGQA
jgi:hypothetical protein